MAAFAKRYLRFDEKNPCRDEIQLLWPVYVYRVMYPVPKEKALNLFQEAILGLCRAQCTDRMEISYLLDIDHELVAYIMLQMMQDGWIDERSKITRNGEERLDGNWQDKGSLYVSKPENSQQNLKIGYVFWDVFSQKWLPRFASKLSEIEPHERKNSFPTFIMERQRGKPITPYQLSVNTSHKVTNPNLEQLFDAYRSYGLDIHHARQLELDYDLPPEQAVRMDNIEFISDQPEPMYLWVSIFRNPEVDELWSIRDPFGIRTNAPWLRKPLVEISNREKGLVAQLSKLIGETQPEKQTAEEWLMHLDQRIRMEMLLEYPYLEKHSDITRYMTALKRRNAKVLDGMANDEDIESLLTDAQKLIESVLKWMLGNWRVDLRRIPNAQEHFDKEKLARIYRAIHLDSLSVDSIDQLSRQIWRDVHSALKYRDQSRASAKALLCGAILSTTENRDHPFKQLDANTLNFPRLLELADLRNKAGHASGHQFDQTQVMSISGFAIQWTTNFKEWF